MSRLAGLQRVGVSKVVVAPGKESFIYHSHHCEEEWIYVLSGKGIARIDEQDYEVTAGDFMGFPTPSVAHHMTNPFDEDLIYLMGGETKDVEIADFPDIFEPWFGTPHGYSFESAASLFELRYSAPTTMADFAREYMDAAKASTSSLIEVRTARVEPR